MTRDVTRDRTRGRARDVALDAAAAPGDTPRTLPQPSPLTRLAVPDDPSASYAAPETHASRRRFLKAAGAVAASAAAATVGSTVGCAPSTSGDGEGKATREEVPQALPTRTLDRRTLDAVGDVVLPSTIGSAGRAQAVEAFVTWVDEYDPVAEEMHGYGYADVRYLPPDPAPGWQSQLIGLDLLAQRMRQRSLAECDAAQRLEVLTAALATVDAQRLPAPLGAPHVALALLSHWANSPGAWDLALEATVAPNTCRQLDGIDAKPRRAFGGTA